MFAYMVRTLGEPARASKIAPDEAVRYADRVPPALIRFWVEHGRGAYFDGLYWICDPAPFDSLLELIFERDPEFSLADMTVVAYSALGAVKSMAPTAAPDEHLPLGIDRLQSARQRVA